MLAVPLSFNQVLNTSIVAHLGSISTFRDTGREIFLLRLFHFTPRPLFVLFLLVGLQRLRIFQIAIVGKIAKREKDLKSNSHDRWATE